MISYLLFSENSMSKKFPCISCKGTVNMCYSYKVHKHPRFSAYMCEVSTNIIDRKLASVYCE